MFESTTESYDLCCGKGSKADSSQFHPFLDMPSGKGKGARHLKLQELASPIPSETTDTKKIKEFFKKFPYLPYSGTNKVSSHELVCKLQEMKYLSATKGSVMNSINTYSFGGKMQLVVGQDNEFDLGVEEVVLTGANQQAYYDFLKNQINLSGYTYKSITKKWSDSRNTVGEMWAELIMNEENGIKYYTINYLGPEEVCYKITEQGDPEIVGISKDWSYNYCLKKPPKDIPTYPYFRRMPDGTSRTILKYMDGCGLRRGRPEDFSCFVDQYNEYKLSEYMTKQIDTGFLGQVLIEIEETGLQQGWGDEKEAKGQGYDSALDRIEQNYTNRGEDPTSVLAFTRPKGAEKAFVHQFSPNTNEKFYCKVKGELRQSIIGTNDWSEALLIKDKSSGFNSDMFKDIFSILSCTRVLEQQEIVGGFLNMAVKIGAEWLEQEQFLDYQIKHNSPVQKLIEQEAEANEGTPEPE